MGSSSESPLRPCNQQVVSATHAGTQNYQIPSNTDYSSSQFFKNASILSPYFFLAFLGNTVVLKTCSEAEMCIKLFKQKRENTQSMLKAMPPCYSFSVFVHGADHFFIKNTFRTMFLLLLRNRFSWS